jgi:hypothetical protein
MGISMAWPDGTSFKEEDNVPPKLGIFLDNFELGVNINA